MISINQVQAAIVTALKESVPLGLVVGDEIRESQWQGTQFTYPAIRVDMEDSRQVGRGGQCVTTISAVPFNVVGFSEEASSQQADRIIGLVISALLNHQLTSADFSSGFVRMSRAGQSSAKRATERVWRAVVGFEVNIYET